MLKRSFIEIAVSDTGVGIAPEDLLRVFQPFVRTPPPDGSAPPGSGLGLSIASDIAAAHGGCITVESAPGKGARFFLTIPASFRLLPGAE